MNRNRVIIATIIICLLFGNVVYALVTGERKPFSYVMNNKMNYEATTEETEVAQNEEVTMDDDEVEFSTEETTEESEDAEETTSKGTSDVASEDGDGDPVGTGDGGKKPGKPKAVKKAKKLVDLICSWPGSDSLLYGKPMNTAAISVKGKYDNGDIERIPIENCTIEGFDPNTLGSSTINIKYYGFTKALGYTILNYELGITCSSWEKRYSYRYGDEFSKSDMVVVANMADGSTENISADDFSVSGIEMKVVGDHSCTITHNGFSISEAYKINNFPVALKSSIRRFTVRGKVSWSDVVAGQTFSAEMADGTTKDLGPDDYQISGYSTKTAGKTSLTVSYEEVSLSIPYNVYYDSLKVDTGNNVDQTANFNFTTSFEVSSSDSLGLPEEYKNEDTGVEYVLEGIYTDSEYKTKIDYPAVYEADKALRINSDGLAWHEYVLYAKYVVK